MIVYRCTECDCVYSTLDLAGQCHWGIGGVVEEDNTGDEPATDEQLEAIAEAIYADIANDPVRSAMFDYLRGGGRLTTPSGDLRPNWVEAILDQDGE